MELWLTKVKNPKGQIVQTKNQAAGKSLCRTEISTMCWLGVKQRTFKRSCGDETIKAKWNNGVIPHGNKNGYIRDFYFDKDYFNDNGQFWSDLEYKIRRV